MNTFHIFGRCSGRKFIQVQELRRNERYLGFVTNGLAKRVNLIFKQEVSIAPKLCLMVESQAQPNTSEKKKVTGMHKFSDAAVFFSTGKQ